MNIILIGFMASGKTSVGQTLSDRLGYTFIDTDSVIEEKTGISVKDIFEKYGEAHFRKLETETIKDLATLKETVVSTGGGIIIKPENRPLLKKAGKVVYLEVSPKQVMERVADYTTRPLINHPDPQKRLAVIEDLLHKREAWYKETADLMLGSETKDIEKNIAEIINMIKGK